MEDFTGKPRASWTYIVASCSHMFPLTKKLCCYSCDVVRCILWYYTACNYIVLYLEWKLTNLSHLWPHLLMTAAMAVMCVILQEEKVSVNRAIVLVPCVDLTVGIVLPEELRHSISSWVEVHLYNQMFLALQVSVCTVKRISGSEICLSVRKCLVSHRGVHWWVKSEWLKSEDEWSLRESLDMKAPTGVTCKREPWRLVSLKENVIQESQWLHIVRKALE